ncbi:MAG: putative transport system permease protein, partial [Solirubrobacteraceae bacterium]|nr:putative transport system permease protein [Solirubrobacteraceae bacterium]
VALGVAVVAATVITSAASDAALRSATADLLGAADVRLRAFAEAGFTPRAVQALRAIPQVAVAAPVSERTLIVHTDPGEDEKVFSLLVIGIDPAVDVSLREPRLTEGVALSTDSPTDALVPASWAARNGLVLGDQLRLDGRREGMPPLRIIGLMADTGFAALERGDVLVVSRLTLDDSFLVPAPIRYVDLDVGDNSVTDALAAVAQRLDEPYIVETAADAAERLATAQASFDSVAFLFGLVAMVVGAFLVGNTLAMTVGERTREFGLLRAAGTTSRQVLELVLRQGLALGIAGGLLGVVAGIVLAAAMIAFLASTRAALVVGLPIPLPGLLLAFALGLGVTLAGAIVPALRAAQLSPIAALRPSRQSVLGLSDRLRSLIVAELVVVVAGILLFPIERTGTPLFPLILSLALLLGGAVATAYVLEPLGRIIGRPFEWFFGAQGLLGRANLSRDRVRTGLTVGAMMIALAAVVALGTVAESARGGAERWVASILPGGNAIRSSVPLDVEAFRPTFESTPGLQVASPVLEVPAVRVVEDGQEEVVLGGIDPNVFQDSGALIVSGAPRADAYAALRNGGAVLVPASFAAREGVEVGNTLTLGQPGADAGDFVVAGIVEYTIPARTPDGALLISAADARDRFGVTTASLWVMVPQAGIPTSVFAAAVRETAGQLAAQPLTARDLAGDLGRSLDRLLGLFDVLALIAVVIGALGIVNTLGIGISERVREIAILRSHGMTVGQVQAMVVAEAAIMGAIAGVLAIATGLGVAFALVNGGAAADLGAGVRLPWSLLVAVVLVGTGVAALAGLYPARVAASLPIVRHLTQFE